MCLYYDYHLRSCNNEVWMLSGAVRVMKYVPAHFVAEQLPQLVLSIILDFHVLTRCDNMLSLSKKRQEYMLENVH